MTVHSQFKMQMEVVIMKKELGVNPYLFPMPVLMIATYSDGDVVNVMNMAWGGICADNMVSLNIEEDRKTSENIKKHGAFTLSIADIPHIEAADFFGIATGNKMPDKFERSGLTAVKSEKVDAPIVQEFPLFLHLFFIYFDNNFKNFLSFICSLVKYAPL